MSTKPLFKRLVPGLAIFASLSMPNIIFAEQQNFDLTQAVDYSLRNNGELKAFREEQGIREAVKTRSNLYSNPLLEFDSTTGALTNRNSESTVSLGFSQEFLTAGKRGKRYKVAELDLYGYSFLLADRARLLTERVRTAFYDTLLAEKRLELAERSIELNRNLLAISRERLAAGDIPELDVNLVRVELLRSQGKKFDLFGNVVSSRSRLSGLMGLPFGDSLNINGSLDPSNKPKALPVLLQAAQTYRPDLKALEAEKAKGDAEITLARADRIPNLTAGLALRRETRAGLPGSTEENYLIGLKFSIPIPVFDNKQTGVQEAQAKKSSADQRYLAAYKIIEREIETTYASFNTADSIVSIYGKDIIPQLEDNLKLVQEAYRIGEIGILAVIEEQKKFFEVNDGYLSALYGRHAALIKLESAAAIDMNGGKQ